MTPVSQTDAAQRFQSGQPLPSVASRPHVSVLVPAKDEAENLPLFMPTDAAMTWGFIIHVFLSGLFTYGFLRAIGYGFYGALIGGLAYMTGLSLGAWNGGECGFSTIYPGV